MLKETNAFLKNARETKVQNTSSTIGSKLKQGVMEHNVSKAEHAQANGDEGPS